MNQRPSDYDARRLALDPQASFLVQAPAGSGKTELLTDRILALLATVQRPEEIVAITFTRKAAAEMHARVMEKLSVATGPEPTLEHERHSWTLARAALAQDQRHSWNLLEFPARLAIQTIDAFCTGLIRRMPYLSQLGGPARVATDPMELYEQAATATLELADDPAYGTPIRELLRHLDVNPAVATSLICAMLAGRDQWLPYLQRGGDRATLEADLYDAIAHEMRDIADAMPFAWHDELPGIVRAAHQVLAASNNAMLADLADWAEGEHLPTEPAALPQWRALAALLLTKEGDPRKIVNKNQGFPPGSAHKEPMVNWLAAASASPAWAGRLALCRELPDPAYTEAQWQAMQALFASLRLAAAQLQVMFAQTGEIDFIEVTQRALQALGEADDPSDLLLRMDARIQHLLIDEFQDTSQPQIDLLEKLTAGWQQDDGRTLFLVGDPMQSIYRFRKAEVGLFLRVAELGIGEVELHKLTLTDNFRSQSGIVEWVNDKFSRLFPTQDDAALSAIRYSSSVAFKPRLSGPAVRFHPIWRAEDSVHALLHRDDGEPVPCDSEAELVLHLVRAALAENRGDADDGNIAILVRARSHARVITRLLNEAGIPHRAVELTGLAQRPVVADLTQLARALAHPGDRLAWLCVLRAPWCGLTLASLHTLVGEDLGTPIPALLRRGAESLADPTEHARLEHVLPILLSEDNAAGVLPFASWVETVWRQLGGPLAYPTPRDAADAESFFNLLEQLAPYAPPDPAVLEAALLELYAAADPAPEGRHVQVMTMHKSKGLQFDTVILPGLHIRGRQDTAPLLRFELTAGRLLVGPIKPHADSAADPISRFLGLRDAQRASHELDRLLYVASTRAKRRLHLTGEIKLNDEKLQSPQAASLLGRLWAELESDVPPPLSTAASAASPSGRQPATPTRPLQRLALDTLRQHQQDRAADKRARPASDAAALVNTSNSGQDDHRIERITGELAHAWLEQLAHSDLEDWETRQAPDATIIVHKQLQRLGLAQDELEHASAIVLDTLTCTLASERGRWLLHHPDAQREWRLVDENGQLLVVDLAVPTETGWLVVDYKTGKPHADEPLEKFKARMLQQYETQLRAYCHAVGASMGKPTRAALYFPRSDHWFECEF